MKKQLLLLFLSLSLMAIGFKVVPCNGIGLSHDCCQKISSETVANPYNTCCKDDDQKKEDPTSTPKIQNDLSFQVVATAVTIVSETHSDFIALNPIQNKSPPKVPIYLNHASLLL